MTRIKTENKQTTNDTYYNVIASIAGSSASQVEGIASVSFEAGLNNKSYTIGKNKRANAIDVKINKDNLVTIDISVNVYYGSKIPNVVCNLQEKIKENVEKSTAFVVKNINVTIVGVVARN